MGSAKMKENSWVAGSYNDVKHNMSKREFFLQRAGFFLAGLNCEIYGVHPLDGTKAGVCE
jgi:hypothetical protein